MQASMAHSSLASTAAYGAGSFVWAMVLLCLLCALMIQRSQAFRVRVMYGGRKYAIPGAFASKAEADAARDLLLLLLEQCSTDDPSTPQARQAPALTKPRIQYYVQDLPVLNIPQSLRPRLAAAMNVSDTWLHHIECWVCILHALAVSAMSAL